MNWKPYFEKHEKRKPREQLVKAVSFCIKRGNALDLGAGTMIESKFLLRKGFKVTAVDNAPEVKKYAKSIKNKKFILANLPFQKYKFPKNTFDLINAQFALPFHGKKGFNTFIKNIEMALKPNGVFVGQFFGKKDSWNDGKEEIVFHSKPQVLKLLSSMKILEFIEEEKDGITASGHKKHWQIFHFIAQKMK